MGTSDAGRRLLSGLTVLVVAAGCAGNASPTPASTPASSTTAAATATVGPGPTPTTVPTIGLPADDGARIIAVESPTTLQHTVGVAPGTPGCPAASNPGCFVPVGSPIPTTRIRDLTIDSPVLGITKVRLLLPKHFTTKPSARWPVLYLIRGGGSGGGGADYRYWSEAQDVTTLTDPTDLLVVMPEGDNDSTTPWDTYHLVELRQLLERNWWAGDRRAVAGISAGGGEAMHEAEREPGMFRFAGSFSGALAIDIPGWTDVGNVAALRGTALFVAYGNGELGPLDHGQAPFYDPNGDGDRNAAAVGAAFVKRLAALKIPVTVYAYGNGTHSAPYWQRDFERSFPLILKALGL